MLLLIAFQQPPPYAAKHPASIGVTLYFLLGSLLFGLPPYL
jgi:hypothetical protein